MNNYFDWRYYINRYEDLRKAGILDKNKAIKHWMKFGIKECRICNKLFEEIDFNYLKSLVSIEQYIKSINIILTTIYNKKIYDNEYINKLFNKINRINKDKLEYEEIKLINNIKENDNNIKEDCIYYKFNKIKFDFIKKYIFHYISFISNDNNIQFDIEYLKDDLLIIVTDYNIFFNIYDIKKFTKIHNIYNINIKSYTNITDIFIIKIENNKLQYITDNIYPVTIINSYNNLYIRKINNNINIIELINVNNTFINNMETNDIFILTRYINDNNIDYFFKNNEEKILYNIDLFIMKHLNLKYNLDSYFNIYDRFMINYKLILDCNILILTNNDWSNTAYRFSKSLEYNGINVILLKLNKHKFNYPEQGIIINTNFNLLEKYPVIVNINNIQPILNIAYSIKNIWFHGSTIFMNQNKKINDLLKDKIYFVSHGGTTYRQAPNNSNNVFNNIVKKTLIQCPDLLDLGAKNERLIYYPVNINLIKPNYTKKNNKKLVFGHYPSSSLNKGTEKILNVIKEFINKDLLIFIGPNNTVIGSTWKSWEEHIQRYHECDIYIETINLTLNGKPFGEWGNTCLEACASGCIVLTNFLQYNKYIKEYNNTPPILITNTEEDLYNNINLLLNLSDEEIYNMKVNSRKWVEEYHSLEKCGYRLKDFIFS